MLKYITLLSCLLLISFGTLRSQTTSKSAEELRAFHLKQIMDAYAEKRHVEVGSPAMKSIGSESQDFELPLSVGDKPISTAGTSEPESEVHAAINPTDTTNIVVCPIHLYDGMTLPIYYTTNFGSVWKKSTYQPLPYESGAAVDGGGDPVFAYDANGTVYVSWIDTYNVGQPTDSAGWTIESDYSGTYWASSTNGGQTWTRPTTGYIGKGIETIAYFIDTVTFTVTAEHLDSTTGFNDKQWMACDRSNSQYRNSLYAAWTYLGTTSSNILVSRKPAGVDSMLPPVKASSDKFMVVQFSDLGVDKKGGLHVTFMGSYNDSDYGIYTVYSSDGGAHFGPEVKIADADIPGKSADAIANGDVIFGVRAPGNYPDPHLSIDTAGTGYLYEVWNALGVEVDSQMGTEIYFSRSVDNGANWSQPMIINNDLDTLFGYTDHFYPSIAVNGKGIISLTWYDRREDINNEIGRYYIGQSSDQGQTWTNEPVASQPMDFNDVFLQNGNFGIGEYTQVLTTPYNVIPVWSDGRDNTGKIRVYSAILSGSPLASVQRISSVSEGVSLTDNYPNPFSTTTKVSFTLASSAHAALFVTNITGQRVASLYDGTAGAGEHDFTFDGSHLPDGVYYLNLESDLGVVREAMTILR